MAEKGIEELGDVEDHYHVHEQIGEGSQGDLFGGFERGSGVRVALKVQKEQGAESDAWFRELTQQLDEEGALNHELAELPGIPRLIGRGHYDGRRCIILEFVDGRLLRDAMLAARPLKDVGTIASIIDQLCEVLDGVHRRRLVHRDLKPENVMIEPNGRIRLLDFGLAARMHQAMSRGGGTIGYAPPEQLETNNRGLTGRADIFALGCLLVEMTVMCLPYGGTRKGLMQGAAVLPADRVAAIPAPFTQLALSMVERDAALRPTDVGEVRESIRPYLPAPGSPRPLKPLRPDPTEYHRTRSP